MQFLGMIVLSFIATISFSVLFLNPKRALLPSGAVGVVGWFILEIARSHHLSIVAGSFAAALVIAFISEILARLLKMPVIVFTVIGIITLVPGSTAFSTMTDFIDGRYSEGLEKGAETLLIAGAIATGLVIAGALMRFGWRRHHVPTKTSSND